MTSPQQRVREFCRQNSICTRCKSRDAMKGEMNKSQLCARCYKYAITCRKSLSRIIMMETEN